MTEKKLRGFACHTAKNPGVQREWAKKGGEAIAAIPGRMQELGRLAWQKKPRSSEYMRALSRKGVAAIKAKANKQ